MSQIVETACRTLGRSTEYLVNSLDGVPAEKHTWRPCETATHAIEMVVECAGIQRMAAAMLRGREADLEVLVPDAAGYPDAAAAKGLLNETHGELVAAMQAVGEADLSRELTMPWGAVLSCAEFLFLVPGHNMYHAGQICYIQRLLGDAEMH